MDQITGQGIRVGLPEFESAECQDLCKRHHKNEHKGHTTNSRLEIKIPDPAGNRIWPAGLEGRNSTDHAMAMKYLLLLIL